MAAAKMECQFCQKVTFKYTCPKCNALYCSVACYKAPEHLKCSEEFYKSCIEEELTNSNPESREDMKKIYDILRRMHESEAGMEPDFHDAIDSDDEIEEDAETCGGGLPDAGEDDAEESDNHDIATRLQNVDINDAEEVWQHLTTEERAEFKKMIDSGEILKLIPNYNPWWVKSVKVQKIVEITQKEDQLATSNIPAIEKQIPQFSSICKKQPSSCLHYNLWNIMSSFACIVRYFNGEHSTNPIEAVAHLVNLSLTLKFGTNFEDVDDAIVSVEMEALTSKPVGVGAEVYAGNVQITVSRVELESDARSLMSSCQYKLSALSDIYRLMLAAKVQLKRRKSSAMSDFHKLFAICNGSVELDVKKLMHLSKKILFLLSYVNRENEQRLD
ncbi:zinc finger HIT domain-containing protein 2 [Eurosta solidaginis]|uniref:zinc finger HIT domain-containing protein 2 n=1 Tax=Eurosta solidaginis TaxID=178769 RepID=UPI00353072B5